jgi:predicted DNA-binding transcriptional regulator YafY
MDFFKIQNRLCLIHGLVSKEITGTPDKFAKRLHLKRRQLYNLLSELKDAGIDIKYSRLRQTFYYSEDSEATISTVYKLDFKI